MLLIYVAYYIQTFTPCGAQHSFYVCRSKYLDWALNNVYMGERLHWELREYVMIQHWFEDEVNLLIWG